MTSSQQLCERRTCVSDAHAYKQLQWFQMTGTPVRKAPVGVQIPMLEFRVAGATWMRS